MSSIYKALSEIYEQPVFPRRDALRSSASSVGNNRSSSVGKNNKDNDNVSYVYTLKSSNSSSKGNDKRARSIASLSRSKRSTTKQTSHLETKLKSPSSYSYTVRNQSGTLFAVGPSNYKIISFEGMGDGINLQSPTNSRYYENDTKSQTMAMISPRNLTYTEKEIHRSINIAQTENNSSTEADFSPLMAEAAQLRALVDETLTLVDAHYSPTSRQKSDLNSYNNKKSFQESVDNADDMPAILSPTAQDILSLLSSIHVGGTGSHSDSLPLRPIQPILNDVLNDDEETFMRSRTHRLH